MLRQTPLPSDDNEVNIALLAWAKEKVMEASVSAEGNADVMVFIAGAINPAFI